MTEQMSGSLPRSEQSPPELRPESRFPPSNSNSISKSSKPHQALPPGLGSSKGHRLDVFWLLYWGPLALVEDSTVTRAMIQFGDALKTNVSQAELKIYALELAHACRDSIAESWKVTLSSVEASRFMSVSKSEPPQ